MSTDLKRRNIPFSPPDMTEVEAKLAAEAIMSGWITTGPKTKEFEKKISAYVNTEKTVCLNSATAAMEFALRLIGVWALKMRSSCQHIPIQLRLR